MKGLIGKTGICQWHFVELQVTVFLEILIQEQSSALLHFYCLCLVHFVVASFQQYLFTILDEESQSTFQEERRREGRPSASFSDNVSQLGTPSFLSGRLIWIAWRTHNTHMYRFPINTLYIEKFMSCDAKHLFFF